MLPPIRPPGQNATEKGRGTEPGLREFPAVQPRRDSAGKGEAQSNLEELNLKLRCEVACLRTDVLRVGVEKADLQNNLRVCRARNRKFVEFLERSTGCTGKKLESLVEVGQRNFGKEAPAGSPSSPSPLLLLPEVHRVLLHENSGLRSDCGKLRAMVEDLRGVVRGEKKEKARLESTLSDVKQSNSLLKKLHGGRQTLEPLQQEAPKPQAPYLSAEQALGRRHLSRAKDLRELLSEGRITLIDLPRLMKHVRTIVDIPSDQEVPWRAEETLSLLASPHRWPRECFVRRAEGLHLEPLVRRLSQSVPLPPPPALGNPTPPSQGSLSSLKKLDAMLESSLLVVDKEAAGDAHQGSRTMAAVLQSIEWKSNQSRTTLGLPESQTTTPHLPIFAFWPMACLGQQSRGKTICTEWMEREIANLNRKRESKQTTTISQSLQNFRGVLQLVRSGAIAFLDARKLVGFCRQQNFAEMLADSEGGDSGSAFGSNTRAPSDVLRRALSQAGGGGGFRLGEGGCAEKKKKEFQMLRRQDLPDSIFLPTKAFDCLDSTEREEEGGRGSKGEEEEEGDPLDGVLREKVVLFALSFGWLSKEHPDNDQSFHLKRMAAFFELLFAEEPKLEGKEAMWRCHIGSSLKRCCLRLLLSEKKNKPSNCMTHRHVGLFWDYASMFQAPRTVKQAALFRTALQNMNIIYSHKRICILRSRGVPESSENSRPYNLRGWPFFEVCVSSMKSSSLVLNLPEDDVEGPDMLEILPRFRQSDTGDTSVAIGPKEFDLRVETRLFTNGADVKVVKRAYRQFFRAAAGEVEQLVIVDRPSFGDKQARSVAGFVQGLADLVSSEGPGVSSGGRGAVEKGRAIAVLRAVRLDNVSVGYAGVSVLCQAITRLQKCLEEHRQTSEGNSGSFPLLTLSLRHCNHLTSVRAAVSAHMRGEMTLEVDMPPGCQSLVPYLDVELSEDSLHRLRSLIDHGEGGETSSDLSWLFGGLTCLRVQVVHTEGGTIAALSDRLFDLLKSRGVGAFALRSLEFRGPERVLLLAEGGDRKKGTFSSEGESGESPQKTELLLRDVVEPSVRGFWKWQRLSRQNEVRTGLLKCVPPHCAFTAQNGDVEGGWRMSDASSLGSKSKDAIELHPLNWLTTTHAHANDAALLELDRAAAEVAPRNPSLWTSLQVINLRSSPLTVEGLRRLSSALLRGDGRVGLRVLNLSGCTRLGSESADVLGGFLEALYERKKLSRPLDILIDGSGLQESAAAKVADVTACLRLCLASDEGGSADSVGDAVLVSLPSRPWSVGSDGRLTLRNCRHATAEGWGSLFEALGKAGRVDKLSAVDFRGSVVTMGKADGHPLLEKFFDSRNLPALRHLNLSRMMVRDVGARVLAAAGEARCLQGLIGLDLSENSITDEGAQSLSQALLASSFPVLEHFDLSSNSIGMEGTEALSGVMQMKALPALRTLELGNNNISDRGAKALAKAIEAGSLISLQALGICLNEIGSEGASALSDALSEGNCRLETLDLRANSVGDEGASALSRAIQAGALRSLKTLNLDQNSIEAEGAKAMACAFTEGSLPVLQTLSLNRNSIGWDGAKALAEPLKAGALPVLQTLGLRGDLIGNEGLIALSESVRSGSLSSLRSLDLNSNGVGCNAVKLFCEALQALPSGDVCSCRLESVDLGNNSVRREGAIALAGAITARALPALKSLDLKDNGVGPEGAVPLCRALEKTALPSLLSLDLSHGSVGSEGCRALGDALQSGSLSNLETLSLSRNMMGIEGIRSIARAIEGGWVAALLSLDLGDNNLGPEGARLLSDALRAGTLPSLQGLLLSRSSIGDEGAKILSGALTVGTLPALRVLALAETGIKAEGMKALSEALKSGTLPALQTLDLRNNEVGGEGSKALSEALHAGCLPALLALRLSRTQMKCADAILLSQALRRGALPALHTLDLGKNEIRVEGARALSEALQAGTLPALHDVFLGDNSLGSEGAKLISVAVKSGRLPALETLDLSQNGVGGEGVEGLANALQAGSVPALRTLNLRENSIGGEGIWGLARALEAGTLPALQSLNLRENIINARDTVALSSALKAGTLPALRHLDLGRNQMGAEGAAALAEVLKAGTLPALQYLGLTRNSIEDEGVTAISLALKEGKLPALSALNLRDNGIGGEGVRALSEALKEAALPALQTLNLRENKICTEGVKALSEALKAGTLPALQNLNLRATSIGVEGAIALSEALQAESLSALQTLNLRDNDIQSAGAEVLSDALRKGNLPALEVLDLSYNQIGREGARAISAALREGKLPALMALYLDNNGIGSAGAAALAETLKSGAISTLQTLSLENNGIGEEGATTLSRALQAGTLPVLETLDLSANGIGDDGAEDLLEALRAATLPALQILDLSANGIGEEGAEALIEAVKHKKSLPALQHITL
uniref:Uncharacterized protein n=1 Tax=Chromera velia CCMP2878 TaxID=1169474 RepID=A0A0G4HXH2_9ALVE|eukprot:Cvel_1495.t1-p1 / transcript=Cvel_1495.t1 / gene=Cvel_1495 / organism=Chromera_velia_CCMP2878 / gene_product=Protein NLRC3, putative / transcript_product=Protein NLRC3, putative / location=Cvel_scaffold52:92831-100994(-) / protein_length=2410 / sequence_SO=supercontig / SO=protein_coding / is_pseudo=false